MTTWTGGWIHWRNFFQPSGLLGNWRTCWRAWQKQSNHLFEISIPIIFIKRNILTYVKADHKQKVADELREIFLAGQKAYSPEQAQAALQAFAERWGTQYDYIKKLRGRRDLHYYFTYLDFDRQVQSMIYTTNWVERGNKSFRRSTKIRGALPNPEAALLLLSKVAVDQEDGAFAYPIYNFKFDKTLFPHDDSSTTGRVPFFRHTFLDSIVIKRECPKYRYKSN